MGANETPLRHLGLRTPEGWILVRDTGSTYHDGVEEYVRTVLTGATDLRSTSADLVTHGRTWVEAYHVDPARANIVRGLDIKPTDRVLEIGAGLGGVSRYLGERAALLDAVEPAAARARVARERTRDLPGVEVFVGDHTDVPAEPTYDVIVVIGVLEYVGSGSSEHAPYVAFLAALQRALLPGGTLVLAIENKLGVKYLVGAPEDHTGANFDSIEDYPARRHARTFSRRELTELFVEAGLVPSVRIAFPDYKLTRAVLDADLLSEQAPRLLRDVPVFPSADLGAYRPRLADEGRVWSTLVEAGLAADTGNSFLVLAGNGQAQDLWPADLAGVFYSRNRRETYSFEKRIEQSAGGLTITRSSTGRQDPEAPLHVHDGVEQYVDAPTLPVAAERLSMAEIAHLLQRWRDMLLDRARAADGMPLDFVPHNVVLRPDGSLEAIDQEWTAPGWPVERVLRRGVLWFALQLVQSTVPARWHEFDVIRAVVAEFGVAVGLDERSGWIDQAIAEEAELQAEVQIRQHGESRVEAEGRLAAETTARLDGPFEDLPLGVRMPDIFLRVQNHLDLAEKSGAYLSGELDAARSANESSVAAAQFAEDKRVVAEAAVLTALAAARTADEARRSAQTSESILHERLGMAENRSTAERARAEQAVELLAELRNSRGFRAAKAYDRVIDTFAPARSLRRRVHDGAVRIAVRSLRRLRPTPPAPAPAAPVIMPTSATPRVSIVIPVHGQWEYTERCLRALAETAGAIAFEVIIVDDASPDRTLEELALVQGIRVVPLAVNQGFVGATNAGIGVARGEFVVLLNNDTRVHPLWLIPLLETLADPSVGLVGARLVYPDGRLQEAGGIIFSDGSGWNYGKFGDPEDGAYTYRRDVDYCSGACIILRKATLDQLGNLDTRYAPAYYEDTDLAFAVREIGLRVVYEPRSLVVHDEGVSNGTDEAVGMKAYQVVNKEKFVAKWRERLDEQCAPDVANVPFAARRRNGERVVVVIDHYVPRPDEDSGSVRMMGVLRALRELGYAVMFVPDNKFRTEPWTGLLGELGVEVFYGHGDLPGRLRELSDHIHSVIVSRVTVAWTYAFMLRTVLPGVPVIFDTVDLHFLREQRAAQLAGDGTLSPRAKTLKSLELAIAESADTTLVVSPYEQEFLRSILPGADVKVLPNVHRPEAFPGSPDGRAGLLFVGSFAHHPNADGLRWFFNEILPLVEQELPGVQVTVVGRNPDADLVAAAAANVTYLGWVEDLTPLYDHARIALAPLRYGAGVKGKIGEAMAHGVPVVMTPVGAEGMALVHGETAWIASDARAFADGVVMLLSDDECWQRLSKAGAHHIDMTFGSARFSALLDEILR